MTEDKFKEAIRENYYARNKFSFELSSIQVHGHITLIFLFFGDTSQIFLGLKQTSGHILGFFYIESAMGNKELYVLATEVAAWPNNIPK